MRMLGKYVKKKKKNPLNILLPNTKQFHIIAANKTRLLHFNSKYYMQTQRNNTVTTTILS